MTVTLNDHTTVACPNGHQVHSNARFCTECGSPLPTVLVEGEPEVVRVPRKVWGLPVWAVVGGVLVLLAGATLGIWSLTTDDESVPDADPRQFRAQIESFGIDHGAALEVGARVCLIAEAAEGDYDQAISEVIVEFGSAVDIRLITQNAGFLCPEHHELRGAALFRFED